MAASSRQLTLDAMRLARVAPKEQEQKARVPALVGGIDTNTPSSELQPTQSPSIVNMLIVRDRLVPDTGYVELGSGAIVGIPQRAFEVIHALGNTDTILITTERAYFLDADNVWQDGGIALSGQTNTPVFAISYPPSDWIIITNGVDPVFYYYLQSFHQVPFDIPGLVCRSLAVFHESLLLIGTTEADGPHPRRVRASDIGNPTAMRTVIEGASTGVAAIYDLLDTDDDLHCAYTLGPYLILYRHSSIMRATYLGALNAILFWEYMITGEGSLAPRAVAPITIPRQAAYHVLIGQYNVYRYDGSYSLMPIGDAIWQTTFGAVGIINQMAKGTIWAQYIGQWSEVWFGVPTNESTIPDTIFRLSLGQQPAWFVRRFAHTITSASALLEQFKEDSGVAHVLLTSPNGVFDYNFTETTDLGSPIRWSFETKDLGDPGVLSRFDRLLIRGSGEFDIGVETSVDQGNTWKFVDTVNFDFHPITVLTFQITSEYLRFRLSGEDPSFELTWLELWYLFEGEWVPIRGSVRTLGRVTATPPVLPLRIS